MTALLHRLPSGWRFLMVLVLIVIGACALPLAGQQIEPPPAGNPDLIKPGDWLQIQVVGTLPQAPIEGRYQVEASGKLALGPHYGRVRDHGETGEQAEAIVSAPLARLLADAKLQITRYEAPPRPTRSAIQAMERRIDKLEKEVRRLQTAVATNSATSGNRRGALQEAHFEVSSMPNNGGFYRHMLE